jgi:hypothetical protein
MATASRFSNADHDFAFLDFSVPRQIFGNLQARQFPVFFLYSTLASLSLLTIDLKLRSPLLLSHFKSHPFRTISTVLTTTGFWTSTAGLGALTAGLHAVNGIWVTPAASRVMFDRHRLERIEEAESVAWPRKLRS